MALKDGAKQKKRKEEIKASQARKEEEKHHVDQLREAESVLSQAHVHLSDVPGVVKQNMEMMDFMRSKGFIDETGQIRNNF